MPLPATPAEHHPHSGFVLFLPQDCTCHSCLLTDASLPIQSHALLTLWLVYQQFSSPEGLGSVQHLLIHSQPSWGQGPKLGCPHLGRGMGAGYSQRRKTMMAGMVALQTCHTQAL